MIVKCNYLSIIVLLLYCTSLTVSQEDYQTVHCGPPDYYLCRNGNCLPESLVCDGDNDCGDGSDEHPMMCSDVKCDEENEFRCDSGRCVTKAAKCDRQKQCRDGSDERGCDYPPCPDNMFSCANNSMCLPMEEVCDGTIDCKDGLASDEMHPNPCPRNVTCPSYAFKCTNTNVCALPNWMCDGENDCGDNSDEDVNNCKNFDCPEDWFRCADNRCIPMNTVCNGVIDCKDGLASDERHPNPCPRNVTCPHDFFSCDETNICAHPHWLCDGSDDCGDKSDENPERCAAQVCPEGWFRCSNNRCIPPNWRCDGGVDCRNGEDEAQCDSIESLSETTNGTQPIVPVPSAPVANSPVTNRTVLKSAQKAPVASQASAQSAAKSSQSMLEPPTSGSASFHPRRR
ncbi:prolow-density lipoprotein receptor-related protein 1-like [Oppia nitens]|uniref:prolow-density lipoprotein receptor-related protein 1-like n=1 Tax=Oppia nitens TaxID=1686743 RepID=UPI0023DB51C5|nr:prolow-density lipoprotein receptor-related protein 1-like [Oppia nitens]